MVKLEKIFNIKIATVISFMAIFYSIWSFSLQVDRFFWLDEVTTYRIASYPSLSEVFRESKNETMQPPLFYLVARYWIYISSNPNWLRILPFICFLSILYLVMVNSKSNIIIQLLSLYFFVLSPFSLYLMTEFRPYSLSMLFFMLGFHILINFRYSNLFMKLILPLTVFFFAISLSINIPLGIIFFLVSIVLAIKSTKIPKLSTCLVISLYLALFLFQIILAIQLKSVGGSEPVFNFEKYLESLARTLNVISLDIFGISKWLTFAPLIFCALNFGKLKRDKQFLFLILVLVAGYFVLFPTFILHQRISWYSARYSYLLFLSFPIFLILFKNRFPSITFSQQNKFLKVSAILFLLLMPAVFLMRIPKVTLMNGRNSLWFELANYEGCKNKIVKIVVEPDYNDRVGRFHLNLAGFQEVDVVSSSDYRPDSRANSCIIFTNSEKSIDADLIRAMDKIGYSKLKEKTNIVSHPQGIFEYAIYSL